MRKGRPEKEMIRVEDAHENNLVGVSVSLPKGQVIAVAGVSGSGKSTLVHRVIGRMAQRRLGRLRGVAGELAPAYQPQVGMVDGLPPCVEIRQEPLRGQARSTVGTYAGVVDILARLFLHHGDAVSTNGGVITPLDRIDVAAWAARHHISRTVTAARIRPDQTLTSVAQLPLAGNFFVRDRDGQWSEATRASVRPRLPATLWVAVPEVERKLLDPKDAGAVFSPPLDDRLWVFDGRMFLESGFHRLAADDPEPYLPLSRRLFSFNSEALGSGRCECCGGLGETKGVAEATLLADPARPLLDGGLRLPRSGHRFTHLGVLDQILRGAFHLRGLRPDVSWNNLKPDVRQLVMHGSGHELIPELPLGEERPRKAKRPFAGLVPLILERAGSTGPAGQVFQGMLSVVACPECGGSRYNRSARTARYRRVGLADFVQMSLGELHKIVRGWNRSSNENEAAVVGGLESLLGTYSDLSLGYLSLGRATSTLSGGEAQRVRLGVGLAMEWRDCCYLLDEPSRALHPADAVRLIRSIRRVSEHGNTVVLVENNPVLLSAADHSIVLGPGGGTAGGRVIHEGSGPPPLEPAAEKPAVKPGSAQHSISLAGVTCNNVRGVDFEIPLNRVTAVVGVSGAGKSSAILRALVPAVQAHLEGVEHPAVRMLRLPKVVEFVEVVGQKLIGSSRRSIVATVLEAYDDLRAHYASLPSAKALALGPADFSFNSSGACRVCEGTGVARDGFGEELDERCHACAGSRFGEQPLVVRSGGRSIAELLDQTVAELRIAGHPSLSPTARERLDVMDSLGLGHLQLGRAVPTLSAGERQRLALARFLTRVEKRPGQGVLILDEPTAGLSGRDAARVFGTLAELTRAGSHTLVVIEHKLGLLPHAHWILEFGPGGGPGGGRVVFQGTFSELRRAVTPTALALRNAGPREGGQAPVKSAGKVPDRSAAEWRECADSFESFVVRHEVRDHTAVAKPLSPAVRLDPARIPPDTRAHELLDLLPSLPGVGEAHLPPDYTPAPNFAALADRVAGRAFGFSPVGPWRRKGLCVPADVAVACKRLGQLGFRSALVGDDSVALTALARRQLAVADLANVWVVCEADTDPGTRDAGFRWGQGVVRLIGGADEGQVVSIRYMPGGSAPQIGAELHARHVGDRRSPAARCVFCRGTGRLPTYPIHLIVADRRKCFADDAFWHPCVFPAVRSLRRERLLPEAKFFAAQGVADFYQPYGCMDEHTKFLFEYGIPWRRFLKAGAKRTDREQDFLAWKGLHDSLYSILGRIEDAGHKQQLKSDYREIECTRCRGTGAGWEAEWLVVGERALIELLAAGTIADAAKSLPVSHPVRRVIELEGLGKIRLSGRFGELGEADRGRLLAAMAALSPLANLALVSDDEVGPAGSGADRLIRQQGMVLVNPAQTPQPTGSRPTQV